MGQIPLSRFEKLAQRLVEGSFSRLFGGELDPLEVATRLARVLEDSQRNGRAADFFHIYLHPDDYDSVCRQNPELADELAGYVTRLAQQAGLSLAAPPQIQLTAEPTLGRHQIRVGAEHRQTNEPTTQVFRRDTLGDGALAALHALDAYLIVEGRRHVPLEQPLITLGRRTDNDVVLDSPTVSRQHAQIRWRYGRFVLYDLSRRGRTVVNGEPVTEHALQAGDVIALSNVLLIYGEDDGDKQGRSPSGKDGDRTLWKPPSGET
jgi:hypothetical protein